MKHSFVGRDCDFGTPAADALRLQNLRWRSRGVWHGGRIVPTDPVPGEDVTVSVTVGGDVSLRQMVVRYTVDGTMPDSSSPALEMVQEAPQWDTLTWRYVEGWTATIPSQDAGVMVRYRIQAITDAGEMVWADTDVESGEPGLFGYGVDRDHVPAWLRESIIYHVFLDRFAPDPGKAFVKSESLNDFRGGTIKGLTARLDHIADLGATAICLSSVFPSPTHHGYDATNYTSIEPRLGTEDDIVALIEAAHMRDIRVLLEMVVNPVSSGHPGFDAAKANADNPEQDWFSIKADGPDKDPAGAEAFPQMAVDHDAAGNDLINSAIYWLERDVDGYRIVNARGLSHAFSSRCRRALRAVKRDVALIGEVAGSAETVVTYEGRLDGTLDFLLMQQIRAFFAFDEINASEFWRFVSRHLAWMPAGLSLPSLLDNHDMNRFLWVAGGDTRRLKIAALVQCALPHPPVVYYGTEVGLNQRHDMEDQDGSRRLQEFRTPMIWGEKQDRDLRSFYRALLFWRTSQRVHASDPVLVYAGDEGLLCFRTGQWFVVLNRSDEDAAVDFSEHGEVWLALGTEFDVQLHGSAIQLPPMSGAILRA